MQVGDTIFPGSCGRLDLPDSDKSAMYDSLTLLRALDDRIKVLHVHGCMRMHMCMHTCMYLCMHMCMYLCMHMCMYLCMHMCIKVHLGHGCFGG